MQIAVLFRDEDGTPRRGELVNPHKVLVEMGREVIAVQHETPAFFDVTTFDGETLSMHKVPVPAIVKMREVVPV